MTVSVGDCATPFNSDHRVIAEGTVVIGHLVPDRRRTVPRVQTVTGRRDRRASSPSTPGDGTNTKIDYVDIDLVVPAP